MLLTTTNTIEGKEITQYFGIVSGETIIGANVFKDFFAGIRDIVGGRAGSYESVLREAKETALKEMSDQASQMGANAVIAIDLDYETVGGKRKHANGYCRRYGSYRNPEGLKYNYLLKYPLHLPINLLIVFNIYYNPR